MNKGIIIDNKDIIKQNPDDGVIKQNNAKSHIMSVNNNNPDVHKSFVKATTSETIKSSVNDDMISTLKSAKTNAITPTARKMSSTKSDKKILPQLHRTNEKEQSLKEISNDSTAAATNNDRYSKDNRGIGKQDKPKLKGLQKNRTSSKGQKSVRKQHSGVASRVVGGTKSAVTKSYKGVEGTAFQDENVRTFITTKNTTKAILNSPKTTYKVAKTTAKTSYKTAKVGFKATKAAVKVVYSAATTAVKAAVAAISFIISNLPIILVVLAVVAVVVSIISVITSIITNITLKSDDIELTKAYSYMTQLDSELTAEIVNLQFVSGQQTQLYVNGVACDINSFEIKTDVDVALAWFDAEYEDYAFNAIIYGILGGTNIKEEIELIWQDLYSYETTKIYDEHIGGNIIQIKVHSKPFDDFAEHNVPVNKYSFEFMKEIGIFTSKSELLKPFNFDSILNRYGYYCRPVTKKIFGIERTSLWLFEHPGIDLKADEGTEVKAGINGTVTFVGSSDEYGNCVRIESNNAKSVIYYSKLKDISVKKDKKVKQGDVIGHVGNTGTSCSEFGSCLHVEYYKNGDRVVPSMYFK